MQVRDNGNTLEVPLMVHSAENLISHEIGLINLVAKFKDVSWSGLSVKRRYGDGVSASHFHASHCHHSQPTTRKAIDTAMVE